MPSSNQAEVILSRAVLIHTIMMGEKINLPVILQNSIYDMAHPTSSTAALGHSSLIQLLCERAGVDIPAIDDKRDEVQLHPTLDAKLITLQRRIGGEGYVGLAPGRKKVPEASTSAGTSATNPETRAWLTMVEKRLSFLRRRIKFMQTSQQSFQSQMWSMMAQVCEAQGVEPTEFHYHMYPHSEEEDAFEAEADRHFGFPTDGNQAGEDTVPTDGNDAEVDIGGDDDDDGDDHYSPMDQEDHGSYTAVAPLASYDPVIVDSDDNDNPDEDTD